MMTRKETGSLDTIRTDRGRDLVRQGGRTKRKKTNSLRRSPRKTQRNRTVSNRMMSSTRTRKSQTSLPLRLTTRILI